MWFLDMPVCNIGTVEKFFDTSLTEKGLVWSSVVGFQSDTTNVVGMYNSVLFRVEAKQSEVYSRGCVCHLANLCLLAGVKVLPVDVDDLFVDLFQYSERSAKLKEEFQEFQEFSDTSNNHQALKNTLAQPRENREACSVPFMVILTMCLKVTTLLG